MRCLRTSNGAQTRTQSDVRHVAQEMRRAPAADDRARPCAAMPKISSAVKIDRLVLSAVRRSSRPGAAVEQADDVALAHAHAVGEMVDDFVVDDRQPERLAQAARDVLAQRAHLARDGDDRHVPPLA